MSGFLLVPLGDEYLVNTEVENDQGQPVVTTLANGGFVVAWTTGDPTLDGDPDGISARIFDANGQAVGNEFLVNTKTAGDQRYPSITALADGGFVVTWTEYLSDGNVKKAKVFDETGDVVTDEFTVIGGGSVTTLTNGNILVLGSPRDEGAPQYHNVTAEIYDTDGNTVVSEFLVNTKTALDQYGSVATELANGDILIVWVDSDSSLGGAATCEIKAKLFDASGNVVKNEFRIDVTNDVGQTSPDIVALANGGFAVTWTSNVGTALVDVDLDIIARIFDATGTSVTGEFRVNDETVGFQDSSKITALDGGQFIVTWVSAPDEANGDIKAKVFDADGSVLIDEFTVNSQTTGHQGSVEISSFGDSQCVIAWETRDPTQDGSRWAIKSQIFSLSPTTIDGTDGNDDLNGTAADDRIYGHGGNDTIHGLGDADYLYGGLGSDQLFGGTGDDHLFGNDGNDTLNGEGGADTMAGGDGADTYVVNDAGDVVEEAVNAGTDKVRATTSHTLAGNVEQLFLLGSANLNGKGNALANLIVGNSGNNILDGKAGADTLRGLAGNDVYFVNDAGDVVQESLNSGIDKVRSTVNHTLAGNVEQLFLLGSANLNGNGNALANLIVGNSGNNALKGNSGDDTLKGGAGADRLTGGLGRDVMYGGADTDSDVFVFASIGETGVGAQRDLIYNFASGIDQIDLHLIDADTHLTGNQAFDFSSSGAAANSVWLVDNGSHRIVRGDVDGDATPDFESQVMNVNAISSSDLLL